LHCIRLWNVEVTDEADVAGRICPPLGQGDSLAFFRFREEALPPAEAKLT